MSSYQSKKIGFIIFICFGTFFFIIILLTSPVSKKNSTVIDGHFESIVRRDYRSSVSYDLYIREDNQNYKIPADWSQCFLFNNFQSVIKEGQPIKIYVNKGFNFSSVPKVISLNTNNIDYISQDCINNKIIGNKTMLPLGFIGVTLIFGFYLYIVKKRQKQFE